MEPFDNAIEKLQKVRKDLIASICPKCSIVRLVWTRIPFAHGIRKQIMCGKCSNICICTSLNDNCKYLPICKLCIGEVKK